MVHSGGSDGEKSVTVNEELQGTLHLNFASAFIAKPIKEVHNTTATHQFSITGDAVSKRFLAILLFYLIKLLTISAKTHLFIYLMSC